MTTPLGDYTLLGDLGIASYHIDRAMADLDRASEIAALFRAGLGCDFDRAEAGVRDLQEKLQVAMDTLRPANKETTT